MLSKQVLQIVFSVLRRLLKMVPHSSRRGLGPRVTSSYSALYRKESSYLSIKQVPEKQWNLSDFVYVLTEVEMQE